MIIFITGNYENHWSWPLISTVQTWQLWHAPSPSPNSLYLHWCNQLIWGAIFSEYLKHCAMDHQTFLNFRFCMSLIKSWWLRNAICLHVNSYFPFPPWFKVLMSACINVLVHIDYTIVFTGRKVNFGKCPQQEEVVTVTVALFHPYRQPRGWKLLHSFHISPYRCREKSGMNADMSSPWLSTNHTYIFILCWATRETWSSGN